MEGQHQSRRNDDASAGPAQRHGVRDALWQGRSVGIPDREPCRDGDSGRRHGWARVDNPSIGRREGVFRVQFVQEDGSSYLASIPISTDVRTPQRAVCLFSHATWGSWSKADRGNKLQPSQIRKVMVGVNSKTDAKINYTVGNLEWIRF